MKRAKIESWSGVFPTETYLQPYDSPNQISTFDRPFVPHGAGNSFGDAAYISDGVTLTSDHSTTIINYDADMHQITCESGVSIGQLHVFLEDTGHTFPIYGGSQWVTMGGAIASDIHGKNHQDEGSFGHHIHSMEIILSDGSLVRCSPGENSDLFQATIGGMGLTGFIKTVTLNLRHKRRSAVLRRWHWVESFAEGVACFSDISSEAQYYTEGRTKGRKPRHVYSYVNSVEADAKLPMKAVEIAIPTINLTRPFIIGLASDFLWLTYNYGDKVVHPWAFNFIGPHQHFRYFNKFLGPVLEYQFVVPEDKIQEAYDRLVNQDGSKEALEDYGFNMKKFGDKPSMGLLSFPIGGYSVALIARYSPRNLLFFQKYAETIMDLGGRIYLAKDCCIVPEQFERMYANLGKWREIVRHYDPNNRVRSDLSIRLNMKPWG